MTDRGAELAAYSPKILKKPQIVAANKIDMTDEDSKEYLEFKAHVEDAGVQGISNIGSSEFGSQGALLPQRFWNSSE